MTSSQNSLELPYMALLKLVFLEGQGAKFLFLKVNHPSTEKPRALVGLPVHHSIAFTLSAHHSVAFRMLD